MLLRGGGGDVNVLDVRATQHERRRVETAVRSTVNVTTTVDCVTTIMHCVTTTVDVRVLEEFNDSSNSTMLKKHPFKLDMNKCALTLKVL